MIPLRDSKPSGSVPIVTILLIVVNGLVWLYELSLGDRLDMFVQQYGLTPLRFVTASRYSGGLQERGQVTVPSPRSAPSSFLRSFA
jgi:hypothetical protein